MMNELNDLMRHVHVYMQDREVKNEGNKECSESDRDDGNARRGSGDGYV